jgi:hypothetical protein
LSPVDVHGVEVALEADLQHAFGEVVTVLAPVTVAMWTPALP